MKLEEFLTKYNYAPFTLEEVADLLSDVTDNEEASGAAKEYLAAWSKLESALGKIGYEFG